jgi:hypothetical protein
MSFMCFADIVADLKNTALADNCRPVGPLFYRDRAGRPTVISESFTSPNFFSCFRGQYTNSGDSPIIYRKRFQFKILNSVQLGFSFFVFFFLKTDRLELKERGKG